MLLKDLKTPSQLKNLSYDELDDLCIQIRSKIIETVSKNGGHLASNLGDVELTLALHKALNCPKDKIVFDVGHQCYAHKLITGRYDAFDTLRQTNGICGFPRRDESEYDTFNTGHASNAISAALGMARARDLLGLDQHIAVVVGDGALTGGMAFEAMNDAGNIHTQLMIILNDNGMSISDNVGAMSNYLTHLRTSKGWLTLKKNIRFTLKKLSFGKDRMYNGLKTFKNRIKSVFIRDKLFSALGIRYFGPIDGSNIKAMEQIMLRVKNFKEPCLLHISTKKGSGFRPAEDKPDIFHGTPPFRMDDGQVYKVSKKDFGEAACETLSRFAAKDKRITVITAAMSYGTGMSPFAQKYPDRLFDVGIAEEHAVTLAGGMALNGLKPFVAIYDSFLQRAFDQITEDVAMQNADVCLLCDRAGVGSNDGSSHHGVMGMSFLSAVPGLVLLSPMNRNQLQEQIIWSLNKPFCGPVAIRYPKAEADLLSSLPSDFVFKQWQVLQKGTDAVLLSYSSTLEQSLRAAEILLEQGISITVVNASTLKPLDEDLLSSNRLPLFIAEESLASGSLADAVNRYLTENHLQPLRATYNCGDCFIPHGSHNDLLSSLCLDAQSLAQRIRKELDS